MLKSSNNTGRLILNYYSLMNDSDMVERDRKRRVLKVRNVLDSRSRVDIVKSAIDLSKKKDAPYIFKLWCEVIALTGKID